jgi:hypothetical protein
LQVAGQPFFYLWQPDPARQLPRIADLGDAIGWAFAILDAPVDHHAIALLGANGEVHGALFDPPADIEVFIGEVQLVGDPFIQHSIAFELCPLIDDATPAPHTVRRFRALRRAHAAQGIDLLDLIVFNTDRVQSMAYSCDERPAWERTTRT